MQYSGKINAYYSHLVSALGSSSDVSVFVVAHMVPNATTFIPSLNVLAKVAAVFPKPKSVGRPEYELLKKQFRLEPLSREWASDQEKVVSFFQRNVSGGDKFLIIDIGGYFASMADHLASNFGAQFIGVLEGTENGAVKYEAAKVTSVPVITVARSPLKLPEDHLVASSVVFSVEAILREEAAEILQTRRACVIGYGRVGRSIASLLRGRGITTCVFDVDPIKLAESASQGFHTHRRLQDALRDASLVICATGNNALDIKGFGLIANDCVIASVTSSDDEFELSALSQGYDRIKLENSKTLKFQENRNGESGRYFYVLAGGNAVNFQHGAVIGPAMQLIEGEKLACVSALISNKYRPSSQGRLSELDHDSRKNVATIWNHHFL